MPQGCGVPRGAPQIPEDSWEEGRAQGFAARPSHPVGYTQRSPVSPVTPCTTGDHCQPSSRERRRIRHWSEPAAPSAPQHPAWALLAPPAPPGNRPGPEIGHVGAAACRRGRSPDTEPSPQRGKPSILPFPPQHGCHGCSHGNSGARLHTKGPLTCTGGRTHVRWGEDLQDNYMQAPAPGWGCPVPASFPTVSSSSSSITHFAKTPVRLGVASLRAL